MKLYAAASVVFLPLTLLGATVLPASPGEPAPLQPADLLREADRSSSLVAEILRGLAIPSDGYEQKVLDGVQRLLKVEDAREGTWAAEKALRAGLRYSLSHQQPGSDNPWAVQLSDRLLQVRRQLLKLLEQDTDDKVALAWADIWLPLYGSDSSIGDDVRGLWARHAEHRLKAGELEAARRWLDRIEENFANSPQADPVRKQLRDRAEALRQQARDVPDGKAVVLLNQALSLWPRLPELRDDLERRRQTYQVLYVAVRDLPEFLSPALAFSDAERQLVELIFEGLVQARHEVKRGPSYRPVLADRLIEGAGPRRPIVLRRDVFWPSGDRFTAADVRHTVGLLKKSRDAAWRDLLEPPRLESNPFALESCTRRDCSTRGHPSASNCCRRIPVANRSPAPMTRSSRRSPRARALTSTAARKGLTAGSISCSRPIRSMCVAEAYPRVLSARSGSLQGRMGTRSQTGPCRISSSTRFPQRLQP